MTGPVSPFSAISLSSSVMMSLMIRCTERPCCGTSPLTEMCRRQSSWSFRSMSRPETPRPRKKTRAPLSLSIRRWFAPPRPMIRLRTFEPYKPRGSNSSRKIFSDHGYLFSGIVGGGCFGSLGATYGFGAGPGGGGGIASSTGCLCIGFMSRIDDANSSMSPGKIALCSLSSFTTFCTSWLCFARSKSSKPSNLIMSCSKDDRTLRCSWAGRDFFQSFTLRQTFFTHSSSG
mmetsp:Transcript_58804/g.151214  ORF Transcript_58804/g.151214 Transcript_58804/m.151214 type:complete len:231 (-) Transcript_58804:3173-3865(-)